MDRVRFEELLAAYGADFRRWPEAERTAGEAFAREHAAEAAPLLREAGALDAALSLAAAGGDVPPELLTRRILKHAPRSSFDRRALLALAACAVFGVLIGFSGGQFAPAPADDDSYFSAAFAAPSETAPGDEG